MSPTPVCRQKWLSCHPDPSETRKLHRRSATLKLRRVSQGPSFASTSLSGSRWSRAYPTGERLPRPPSSLVTRNRLDRLDLMGLANASSPSSSRCDKRRWLLVNEDGVDLWGRGSSPHQIFTLSRDCLSTTDIPFLVLSMEAVRRSHSHLHVTFSLAGP